MKIYWTESLNVRSIIAFQRHTDSEGFWFERIDGYFLNFSELRRYAKTHGFDGVKKMPDIRRYTPTTMTAVLPTGAK